MFKALFSKKTDEELAGLIQKIIKQIGKKIDVDAAVRLWDGSLTPLGKSYKKGPVIALKAPGVVASLLKRPSLDNAIRHYVVKNIDVEDNRFLELGKMFSGLKSRRKLKQLSKKDMIASLAPFLRVKSITPEQSRIFDGDEEGAKKDKRDEKKFMEFHYDLSNEFYDLFLDKRTIYTCAYFTDWDNSIDQAQKDKLEMICRKLRLKEGESLLDIGCGWGGLLIYAAENYGIIGTGVTLATEQYNRALEEIKKRGLEDKITIHLKDYRTMSGKFDKISSIGMYEAIGIAQVPEYMAKVRALLKPDGLFLNHGITRKGKKKKKGFSARPEQRALQKYIFPGGELDDLGNTIKQIEVAGFEVLDVEGWRYHYALTCNHWHDRLLDKKSKAIDIIGEETFRIWLTYLAGCVLAFERGSARLYQTVSTPKSKGLPPIGPTRQDLYL